jgi:hypothetical protein
LSNTHHSLLNKGRIFSNRGHMKDKNRHIRMMLHQRIR